MKYFILFFSAVIISCFSFLGYAYFIAHTVSTQTNLPSQQKSVFSFANPPTESLQGIIATLSAAVTWQSRTATQGAYISAPQKIQQGETLATGQQGRFSVLFPQVATISALENSEVSFEQTLPVNMVLNQEIGTVAYTKLGNVPISIRANDLLIGLDSGECQVQIDATNPYTVINLVSASGSATFGYDDLDYTSHVATISAGETFFFNNTTKKGMIE